MIKMRLIMPVINFFFLLTLANDKYFTFVLSTECFFINYFIFNLSLLIILFFYFL